MNVKVVFSYDGSCFNGWHGDSNNRKCVYIQDKIEEVLKLLFREDIVAVCAGRTDSGVHALRQVCSFKIPYEYNLHKLKGAIEHFVQISIHEICYVSDDFHARFSAKQREYMYVVSYDKSPLIHNRTFYSYLKWDRNLLQEMCDFLIGKQDLAFFAPYSYTGNTNKSIDYCYFKQEKLFNFETINIYIGSKSFFYHQIRNIIGCMLEVCTHKWTMDEFVRRFNTKDRVNCASMISASGLYFANVKYGDES
jgi:tRNA pseudouridine38-40 synthase